MFSLPGLQGRGLGAFHDIDRLTMFADYRVPVVLRQLGILEYSPELAFKVHNFPHIVLSVFAQLNWLKSARHS